MRDTALTKEEKETLTGILRKLRLLPPVQGQIVLNLDAQQKVTSVEMQKVVWR